VYTKAETDAKIVELAPAETTTSISVVGNELRYVAEDGNTTAIDLSLYLDDTNLARLVSGSYDSATSSLIFTRDDASTFSVDASAFFDDTNLVTSVSGKTGDVTLVKGDVGLDNVDNIADSAKNVFSATKLTTARTINGVSFDGTADITVADSTKLPLAGGTMTGAISFAAGQTWPTFNQSTTGNAATATKLETARTIELSGDVSGSASFDGSANVSITATIADDSHNHVISNVDGLQTALDAKIASSEKGAASGVATLDSAGKVPSTQLPSYVDDVLEYADLAGFPTTGESGKIYVALDTNKTYRWSGSAYVYITSGAVDSVAGKTGVITLVKGDVGLGSVDNTADVDKPVSTPTATALATKVDKVTGKDLSTNDFTDLLKTKLDGIEEGATADQTKADIDALGVDAATVSGFTVGVSVPSNALFTDTVYSKPTSEPISYIDGLQTALDGKVSSVDLGDYSSFTSSFDAALV
jgi:hypothetical protein